MRRPLCLLCLVFLGMVMVGLWMQPGGEADYGWVDGQRIVAEGQVYRREYKEQKFGQGQTLALYLKEVRILNGPEAAGVSGYGLAGQGDVGLLKEENVTPEQRRSYLDTLERKSLRLKVLIEDLFEISKASSGNVRLDPVAVDICNLMRQVYLEHEEQMIEKGLEVRFDLPQEKVILQLDSQKTYRIFENLYVNVIKYALPNTRVYVQARVIFIKEGQRTIHIEMKNISAQELTVTPTDLTERFVRGDASRNTEGSGLGLAIAKSFSELQGGRFYVEIDGDLFKAILEWDT